MNQNIIGAAIAQVMPLAVGTGLFVSLCSVSAPTPASGAITGVYSPVAGLQLIPCMDAPESTGGGFSVAENKAAAETESMAMRHVLLNGYYAQLSPAINWGDIGWRAAVDGTVYDILGAECDSQKTQTRIRLRKVTV